MPVLLLLEIGQACATMATTIIIIIYCTVLNFVFTLYYYSVHDQNKKSNLQQQ